MKISTLSKNLSNPDNSPIRCPQLPEMDTSGWEAIECGFREAPVLVFHQPWLVKQEPGFPEGRVRIGWRGDRFLYFAELEDRDVMTRADRRNQRLWDLGDVLELFAGVRGHPSYIEYHAAPNALTLQLRFPSSEAFEQLREGSSLEPMIVIDDAAMVQTRTTGGGWEVYGELPTASVWGGRPPADSLSGQVWDVSFGRYDHSRDSEKPILSTTSPLTQAAFHRRREWRQVEFVSA
jgi:hypothetical protein